MPRNTWMLLVIVVALVATGCSGKYKQQVADQETEISQLQQKVQELESEVAEEQARADQVSAEMAEALSEYRAKEQVWLEQKENKSIINVSDVILFGSGSADLTPEGKGLVDKIVGVASKHTDRMVMIEGHTDNVPIGASIKDKYQSNWELASGRACSVLRYMYWKHKMNPEQLSAVGYGEYKPIADNDTPEGRSKNRRVTFVISPMED
jgi:chemotaxis protein MotB